MRALYTLLCLALLLASPATSAQDEPPPRTGLFEAVFEERHPDSAIRRQAKRFGWKLSFVRESDPEGGEYELADESFKVYVPAHYDGSRPFGLLVWISPADDGRLPAAWKEVVDEHDLIVVGPDRAGNERFVWYRMGLALDAVHNLTREYEIDPDRVYVTGFSGGGRLASRLGFHYPEVFRGGIYQGGCSFWEDVPVPDDPSRRWPAHFPKPSSSRYGKTRRHSRHVLLQGEHDPNRDHARAIHDVLVERLKFAHVLWLELEGTGHQPADAAALEAALEFLDAEAEERD